MSPAKGGPADGGGGPVEPREAGDRGEETTPQFPWTFPNVPLFGEPGAGEGAEAGEGVEGPGPKGLREAAWRVAGLPPDPHPPRVFWPEWVLGSYNCGVSTATAGGGVPDGTGGSAEGKLEDG